MATTAGDKPAIRATSTGIIPLSKSPANVIAPAPLPPARVTLVIPILPEPTPRGSKPKARPTSTPTGIDPNRYAAMKSSAMLNKCGLSREREMVGVTGFEPATSASRTQRSSQAELHPARQEFRTGHHL